MSRVVIRRSVRPQQVSLRTVSFGSTVARADTSRQVDPDSTKGVVGGTVPLQPTYDLAKLDKAFERSNILGQCVAAMSTNIAMNGWEVVPSVEGVAMDEEEKAILQSFIDSPNHEESLTVLHANVVDSYERRGFSFIEAIRDATGSLSILRGTQSSTIRLCPKNPEPVLVRYDVVRGPKVSTVREHKTFRIYVQRVGGKSVYFKEFGDPRRLNRNTGKFHSSTEPVPKEDDATELLHFKQQSEDVYGLPRWINQLPAILGSREVEEVNLRYFEDNTVPPMILSVAGGRLTKTSFDELSKLLSTQGVGKDRQNRILLIEAIAERESLEDKGSVQLKIDKLTDARQSDGLFKDYDESNQSKAMSSFRLPPIAVGKSSDHNFATAQTAMSVAESQVYAPERKRYEELYNKRIVMHPLGLNLKTVALRAKSPVITNPEVLIKSLTALNVMGALTPRTAQLAVVNALQITIPLYPEKGAEGYEEWMDMPMALSLKSREGIPTDTQDEQSGKDSGVKGVEQGDGVGFKPPEHGEE